jgi:heme/copper-type cytochrome/quinol oxidase subunit 3
VDETEKYIVTQVASYSFFSVGSSELYRSIKSEHYGTNNHFGVEAAEIYWHFVDVIWIILFILLYLI